MGLEDLFIKQVMVGPMMNFVYIVADKVSKVAALVDPGWEGERLVTEVKEGGFELAHLFVTHTHFDHIGAVADVLKRADVRLYVHGTEAKAFGGDDRVLEVADGDWIDLGGFSFEVIHTPGHSPGGVCYAIERAVFTGDTLFVDGIGRVDLPGSDVGQMFSSLERLRRLPDGTIVYPGHHYGSEATSTMGSQKKTNPYFSCRSMDDFIRMA